MTQFSYSRVGTFTSCPRKYRYRYIDRLRTLPDQSPDNALYLGLGLHKGIETTVDEGVAEYMRPFYCASDLTENWKMQLECVIEKVKAILPEGEHEVELDTPTFKGFIDLLVPTYEEGGIQHYDMYDFKYSNNVANYLESPQLSIYKYYYELTHPNTVVDNLYFVFVPKLKIRQKKTETIVQFRDRLRDELALVEPRIQKIEYFPEAIDAFHAEQQTIECATEYPKAVTRLCDWCEYKSYCFEGDTTNLAITHEEDDRMTLPKAERREAVKTTRRTMWIYGAPYTGKSTLADHAPMPLFLNTDGNAEYLTAPYISLKDEVKVEGRMTKRKFAWEVFKETIDELEKGGNGFKTIVLDLVDDVREMCRLYMYNKLGITHESDDSYRAWDKIDLEFLSTLRRFMTLPYENIILVSHEDTTKDLTKKSGDRITSIKPNIREKTANKLAGMVGFTARVYVDEGKHKLSIKSDEVTFGGGRLGLSNVEVPLEWAEVEKLFELGK